eukprot:327808-Pleurochrysis_carterae.AAC.5
MAACARVKPAASATEGTEAADLLASASKRAVVRKATNDSRRRVEGLHKSCNLITAQSELLVERGQTGKSGGSQGRDIDVEEGFNMRKGISVNLIGA